MYCHLPTPPYLLLPAPTYSYLPLPTPTYSVSGDGDAKTEAYLPTPTYSYLLLPPSAYFYLLLPTPTYSYLLLPAPTYSYLCLPLPTSGLLMATPRGLPTRESLGCWGHRWDIARADFYRFLPIFWTFLGDFDLQRLP